MPLKKFNGPIGDFKGILHTQEKIELQVTGLGAVAIEALDRHYFGKKNPDPFHCPVLGCDFWLEKAGQWTQHAVEAHSVDMFLTQPEILPHELQHGFKERKHNLEKEAEANSRKFAKIFNDWNEVGGEKRRKLERAWIHQLDNDEAWNTQTVISGNDSNL
ncbi:hypothetical protein J1614_001775 [Plenodomus biglobosus]|nr:hypothetical protein J1614_001775 [Plenodomus biglobosus]